MIDQTISVVINTFNEEHNLPYVLRSVYGWADEIIIVDMHSTDNTVDIAKSYGAKVYSHDNTGFVEPARAYAVSKTSCGWVLILDADELIPSELKQLLHIIMAKNTADVVVIPRRNYLLGVPLIGAGWGPNQDMHARFFRRGMLQFEESIHSPLKPASGARVIKLRPWRDNMIIHFNYLNSYHFISKLNKYTNIEAQQAFDRGDRANIFVAIFNALIEFMLRYFLKKGFLDGWRGLYLSIYMSMYQIMKYAKLKELEAIGNEDSVKAKYNIEADKYLTK